MKKSRLIALRGEGFDIRAKNRRTAKKAKEAIKPFGSSLSRTEQAVKLGSFFAIFSKERELTDITHPICKGSFTPHTVRAKEKRNFRS